MLTRMCAWQIFCHSDRLSYPNQQHCDFEQLIMNLLLLSSSKVGTGGYLASAKTAIYQQLSTQRRIIFIPYAGVTISYDDYATKVREALPNLEITSIHECDDPLEAIKQADALLVGGGNTFHLLHALYQYQLVDVIKARVQNKQLSYVGWSAGSNVAGISIRTTNDMPIIAPPSFNAINLVDLHINPHFTDAQLNGHNGETRSERLAEFMVLEPNAAILALPEGAGLQITGDRWQLIGEPTCYRFKGGKKLALDKQAQLTDLLTKSQ